MKKTKNFLFNSDALLMKSGYKHVGKVNKQNFREKARQKSRQK